MTTETLAQYPDAKHEVQQLVKEHLKLKDEPLLLAIYYKPERDPQDVFLFEVVENFGEHSIDADRELFEVTYNQNEGASGQKKLHLVLTNPEEFKTAIGENWPQLKELRRAISNNNFVKLHAAARYKDVKKVIGG